MPTILLGEARGSRRSGSFVTTAVFFLSCLAGLLCIVGSAHAAMVTVTSAGDAGAGSLRDAIAAANSEDTVAFDASLNGQTIELTSGAITLDKSLKIEGPGVLQLTIEADHKSRIFAVTSGDLSISDLTLANGAGLENGGAIYSESTGSLTVSDCTFMGNTAGGAGGSAEESNLGRGGAIYVSYSSAGPTSISDSTFSANTAGGQGGTGFQSGLGSGGAIWDGSDSLVVSNSTFTGNRSGGDGGGGQQSGNGAGGAIQKAGGLSLNVADSEFTGNIASGAGGSGTTSGHGVGGAIYVSRPSGEAPSLTVEDSSFTDNAAGGAGGGGDASGSGEGGAIEHFSGGPVVVSGTTFEGNSAGGDGGVGGSTLFGRGSGAGRAGAILVAEFTESTSISDSTFRDNMAGGDGGGGFLSGRGEGGAIADYAVDQLTISDSTFRENAAGGAKGSGNGSGRGAGGAVYALGSGSLTVTDSSFNFNAVSAGAGGSGGAIDMWNRSLTASGSTFAGNTVGEAGGGGSGGAIDAGAISSLKASASISNSTLFGNDAGGGGASGRGGAINIADMYSATLASVTIDGNSVGGPGGTGAGINIKLGGVSPEGAIVTAKATILSSNMGTGAVNCDVPVASSSYSLEGLAGQTSCGLDLPSADPELGPLLDNGGPTKTQALPPASPAVDAVPVAKCPTTVDQRGEPRPDNGKALCDVGAYELQDPAAAPAITSAPVVAFRVGKKDSFTVTATGAPVPDLSRTGALPAGIVFTDKGYGTATLSGTPSAGAAGSYPITIEASNGVLPDATQSFMLTVQAPPTVGIATPADGAVYELGQAVSTSFTCTEGVGGPGIVSCVDHSGRPSGAVLDTSRIGNYTLRVDATSQDGLKGSGLIDYRVIPKPDPQKPPHALELSLAVEGRSLKELLETGKFAVAARVNEMATVTLAGRAKLRVKARRGAEPKLVLVFKRETAHFSEGGTKKMTLALTRKGRRMLQRLQKARLVITGRAIQVGGETARDQTSLTLRR